MKNIIERAHEIEEVIAADRRAIHKEPEIGFYLPKTAAYIKRRIDEMCVEYRDCGVLDHETRENFAAAGFGGIDGCTGVTATIGNGAPCILLRADMDALPMEEKSGLDFASVNGLAHTCGHDSHSAMLLGAARILKENEASLKGTVKLMFQPGEEFGCGSRLMINDGLLEGPSPDAALALHVMSDAEAGNVGYVKGAASSSYDTFIVKIRGQGGHSSAPHLTVDPVMIANQLYMALNLLPGRETDPRETVALTIGRLAGGSAANIIPDGAEMQIGVRTFNMEIRDHLAKRIPEMIEHIVKAWRGDYEMNIFYCPLTYNSPELCGELLPFINEAAGAENVREESKPMAGTEDFGYISQRIPSMFLWLGAGKRGSAPLHNPAMILDESVFWKGSSILANCAAEWLAKR